MKTTVMLDNNVMETLLIYTQATSSKEAIYQAIQEYISYKKRQELLALRGKITIDDNWQELRDLEINP
jgi:hypothetical protein